MAEFVTTNRVPGLILTSGKGEKTGALLTSFTIIVNEFVLLRLGTPSSVTRMKTTYVNGPCASVGAHENRPLLVRLAPVGIETDENVSVLTGTSTSDAKLVTSNVVSSLTICVLTGVKIGASFTGFTVNKNEALADVIPSLTETEMVVVPN